MLHVDKTRKASDFGFTAMDVSDRAMRSGGRALAINIVESLHVRWCHKDLRTSLVTWLCSKIYLFKIDYRC